MSIVINIPSLKKPKRCIDCPLLYHIEEDYDHYDHYECVIECFELNNRSNIGFPNTPIFFEEAYEKIVLDCPIKDYSINPPKETDEFELIEDYYNE